MDKKIKNIFLIIFFIIIFLLLLFSVFFSLININNNNILNGISIEGIDISGLSKEDAIKKIDNIIQDKKNKNIQLNISSESNVTASFDYLNINYNLSDTINDAYNIGRSGNIFKNNYEIFNLLINGKNLKLNLTLNDDNLKSLSNELSSNLDNKLIQSSFYIDGSNLIITKGSSGNIVDYYEFSKRILNMANNLNDIKNSIDVPIITSDPNEININDIYNNIHKDVQDAYYDKESSKISPEIIGVTFNVDNAKSLLDTDQDEYIIPLEYSYPKVTINDLNVNIFKDKLGSFTTYYDISNKDRSKNLELAASKINGKIIAPGESFSYNSTVGARTIEAGYKESKIYSNGKVTDGIGGGICQLSSTLYNSVFFANLDIKERYNHQFLTSYIKEGRDATVVYGVKDFKFLNNRTFPIKIETKVSNGIVSCSIYGIKEDSEYDIGFDVETVSSSDYKTVYEYDSSVEPGKEIVKQSGSNGMTVNVYKVIKQNGSIISKTFVSQDIYNSLDKIIVKNSENQ